MKNVAYLFIILCQVWLSKCSNILFVGPMPIYSSHVTAFRLAKELADRGHQVTFINAFPQKKPIKNYRDVSVEANIEYAKKIHEELSTRSSHNPFTHMKFLFEVTSYLTEQTLENPNVKNLLNSKEKFDLVVYQHFINEALAGFGYHFNAPIVIISPLGVCDMSNYLFANPSPTSYVPNFLGRLAKHMTFFERIENFLFTIFMDLGKEFVVLKRQRELFKKYFSSDVSLDEVLANNISLMFTNSHISVTDPVPTVPGIIEIGGFHVSPPKKLPEDLQKFMDEAKDGVVLFAMGSNFKSKNMKPHIRAAILAAFAKLKQKVLWKFESDLPEASDNVKITNWLPQQDILAHPNTKAFISHGGLQSTIETIYHGVPIIGIPVFGDQKFNMKRAVNLGYAVQLLLEDITEETLSDALNKILNDPSYQKAAKHRSNLMHDQPVKPLDLAVYWVEHVIRHKGAPHLRSAGLDLAWYQRELIDVIGFSIVTILSVLFGTYFVLKKITNLLGQKKRKIAKHKKNK